jgi:tRNA pseudouridine55 synthase
MAKQRRGRPINGILVLDKPAAESSNRSLQTAKRLYFAQKAGHTGSLDPLATGVLPLCFGEATKFSQFLLDSDKAYRSTFKLGVITASGDADGEVLEQRDASAVSRAQVEAELKQFAGDIEQVPSMFSALKHQGQPLYKLARQGIEVERKVRQVTVYEIELSAFRSSADTGAEPEADVYIHCSKGTYVRSIAEDLGLALGCGAHVTMLRRVKAGPFDEQQAISPSSLEELLQDDDYSQLDALLQPVDSALQHLPAVVVAESAEFYLLRGNAVQVSGAPSEGVVRLYNEAGELLGIGDILDDGRIGPKRLIATN